MHLKNLYREKDKEQIIDELISLKHNRGSCGECDRFTPAQAGFGNCFLIEDDECLWHENDYCSRFERKS